MVTIFLNILVQLFYYIGGVVLVGYLISLINKTFYKIFPTITVCYVTGFLGTPVHELSHALMCVVFGHKINAIKLFQIGSEDGTLGYVQHSYNQKNIYQVIGNYFIGTAPIFCGSALLLLAMRYLAPTAFFNTYANLDEYIVLLQVDFSSLLLTEGLKVVGAVIVSVFSAMLTDGFLWWLFLIIAFCLALHMNLSGPDIQGSIKGCLLLIVLIVALNLILGFTPIYNDFLDVMNLGGGYLFTALLLSLIFSLIMLAIGILLRLALKSVKTFKIFNILNIFKIFKR